VVVRRRELMPSGQPRPYRKCGAEQEPDPGESGGGAVCLSF
jgi:hypothetical protein